MIMSQSNLSKVSRFFSWLFQLIAAVIFLQTLYFKFTAAPESVYIFETVGMEPWGRIGSGIVELIAGLMLFWNRTAWMGASLGVVVISGALISHFTVLGIEVMNDNGTLFYLALTVFISCLLVLWIRRDQVREDVKNLLGKRTGISKSDQIDQQYHQGDK